MANGEVFDRMIFILEFEFDDFESILNRLNKYCMSMTDHNYTWIVLFLIYNFNIIIHSFFSSSCYCLIFCHHNSFSDNLRKVLIQSSCKKKREAKYEIKYVEAQREKNIKLQIYKHILAGVYIYIPTDYGFADLHIARACARNNFKRVSFSKFKK